MGKRITGTGTLTRCSFYWANCRKKKIIGCGLTRGKTLRRLRLRISRGWYAHAPSGIRIDKGEIIPEDTGEIVVGKLRVIMAVLRTTPKAVTKCYMNQKVHHFEVVHPMNYPQKY